jgi:hypothetical protein
MVDLTRDRLLIKPKKLREIILYNDGLVVEGASLRKTFGNSKL